MLPEARPTLLAITTLRSRWHQHLTLIPPRLGHCPRPTPRERAVPTTSSKSLVSSAQRGATSAFWVLTLQVQGAADVSWPFPVCLLLCSLSHLSVRDIPKQVLQLVLFKCKKDRKKRKLLKRCYDIKFPFQLVFFFFLKYPSHFFTWFNTTGACKPPWIFKIL